MDTVFPKDSAEHFEKEVRAKWVSDITSGGPCVLDLTPENAIEYRLSGMRGIFCDLQEVATLHPEILDTVNEVCVRLDIDHAISVRQELINFKKVMQHIAVRATAAERDLRQLAALLFCRNSDGSGKQAEAYRELSGMLQRCRGFAQGCKSVRIRSKAICTIPRHPDKAARILADWHPLDQQLSVVRHTLKTARGGQLVPSCVEIESTTEPTSKIKLEKCITPLDGILDSTLASWPPHIVRFVRSAFIARGLDKALRMRWEATHLATLLTEDCAEASKLRDCAQEFAQHVRLGRPGLADHHIGLQQHFFLTGLCEIAEEAAQWVGQIANARRFGAFVASDGSVSVVPRNWRTIPEAFAQFESTRGHFMPIAQQLLAEKGWPSLPVAPEGVDIEKKRACSHCGVYMRPVWIHRGTCFQCEGHLRAEGRCPFRSAKNCSAAAFCPHASRCLVCEEWSCEDCRLLRLDGEGVAALIGTLHPQALFLDFCQTLANTKNGQMPVIGRHTLQPDLADAACIHGNAHVVTRNRHKEEIRVFLAAQGLGAIPVHSVKLEGCSKATCIEHLLPSPSSVDSGHPVAIFVDDDVAEHLRPDLRALGVWQVLFQHTAG